MFNYLHLKKEFAESAWYCLQRKIEPPIQAVLEMKISCFAVALSNKVLL